MCTASDVESILQVGCFLEAGWFRCKISAVPRGLNHDLSWRNPLGRCRCAGL